jgi:hypothetical protein
LPNIIGMVKSRRMRWAKYVLVERMGRRGLQRGFWRERNKERLLGRHRLEFEDNIKMELREIKWGGMD